MNDQYSLNNLDSLLFQFALQTRELSQKKNEMNKQIKVCRADITERRSYIETLHRDIKKLEEEIRLKQSAVMLNKANAKSMKTTNSLLLQYEQTLKEELESIKASYNHEKEVYEERIASYRKTFQSHKEYYCQNPTAQMLLTLQAEKEEIECRIKACDDQITIKQKELDHLTDSTVDSSSSEKLPDSVSGQQPIAGPEKQLDPQADEGCSSSIDISSLHLNHTEILQNSNKTYGEAYADGICEENKAQHTAVCTKSQEKESNETWSCHQLAEQLQPHVMHTEEQETAQEDQVLQSTASAMEETVEDEIEERVALEEEQVQKDDEVLTARPPSCRAERTAVPSTPTFPFNFSPASSPNQSTSDTKSPAFVFNLNSNPSTPGFSGFGFETGLTQDEESSFEFTSPFFNEKKTTESKSSTCPEFLFGQSEQSEDFHFDFTAKKPKATNKDATRDDFPFSFNF